MASQKLIDDLFTFAMKGEWFDVLMIYRSIPEAQEAKITKTGETALHIAVSVGQTYVAVELVEMVEEGILSIRDVRGNTALHVAAAIGDFRVCHSIASRDRDLLKIRNNNGEIPLFLAAVFGKKETLLYLNTLCTESDLVRRNNGDTILHAAIAGEYFSLAMSIIESRRELVDSMNEDGLSPLHVLASKPNVFRSSTPLGCFDRLLYKCLVVDDPKEQEIDDVEAYIKKRTKRVEEFHKYPQNYRTCIKFLVLLKVFFQVLFSTVVNQTWRIKKDGKNSTADEENPQQKSSSSVHGGTPGESSSVMSSNSKGAMEKLPAEKISRSIGRKWDEDHCLPPNYGFCVQAFKFIMNVLGIGFWRIKSIQQKKKQHMWANRVMNELVKYTTSYKAYDNTGLEPQISLAGEVFDVLNDLTLLEGKKEMKREIPENQLTPILIAAKTGVVEIVEKILDEFPVAIQDLDCNNKNAVLLAVESRQTQVFTLLVNKPTLKESVFRQVDNEGNSALHLAARCNDLQPWFIPGGALQMQWEIKWFKLVKQSMPPRFFPEYNKNQETPEELFNKTHKKLVKDARDSLSKTSNSCSVVAALVASVVFATSTTVPGGVNDASGVPVLKEKPAFQAFVIASVVALCSSVTALVFFLSILACHRYEDFALNLPRKLFLAFTFLIISITSMLLSFFAGHNFIVGDELRHIVYPLYAAVCFPLAIFALEQLSVYLNLISAIFQKLPQQVYEVQRVI